MTATASVGAPRWAALFQRSRNEHNGGAARAGSGPAWARPASRAIPRLKYWYLVRIPADERLTLRNSQGREAFTVTGSYQWAAARRPAPSGGASFGGLDSRRTNRYSTVGGG